MTATKLDATKGPHERVQLHIPDRLRHGDTLGIVSPAGPVMDLQKWDSGLRFLEASGFKVKVGKFALSPPVGYLSSSDENRAQDLNDMLADPEVKAIICSKGGYGSIRLLELLDYGSLEQCPKIVVGFSDITTLLLAFYVKSKVPTFHGPMPMYSFSKAGFPAQNATWLWDVLKGTGGVPYEISTCVEEHYRVLRSGMARGVLVGGNLASLAHLVGTPFMPSLDGSILFIEDIDEEPYSVDRYLTQLKLAGCLDSVSAVVVGDLVNCVPTNLEKPSLSLPEVFADRFSPLNIPVGFGFSFGHGTFLPTFPIGVECEFDAETATVTILQSPVR